MIIIVFGLPGTGKSFFARHFAEETGADYLNTDIVRDELNKQGQYDEKTNRLIYEQLLREISPGTLSGRDVIVDGTFQKKSYRELFSRRSAWLNLDIIFIEMRASDETVKKRMEKERKYSEADYKVYQKIKNRFEPMAEEHPVLRSDILSLDEMIKKIKAIQDEKRTG